MRIRVMSRDGAIETITLVPPVTVHDSPYDVPEGIEMLTHLHCGDGTDHFFTFNEGFYDGWGRGLAEGVDTQEAVRTIEQVESSRETEPPPASKEQDEK